MVEKLKGKISKIINLSKDVKHFEIELEKEFNFLAGQFVNLSINNNKETIRKPYSIASNPNNTNKIELCIKKYDVFKKKKLLQNFCLYFTTGFMIKHHLNDVILF